MGNRLALVIAILSLLIINVGEIYAGEKLSKKEVVDLLSGNTVKAYYMKEGEQQSFLTGTVRLKLKFLDDGSAEKTTYRSRGSKGNVTEKGTWLVNKKGKLCVIWMPENKKRCGRLERTSDGKYELYRKKQKIIYEEIVPGT